MSSLALIAQLTGFFCSAATTDGNWALHYGGISLAYQCGVVDGYLAAHTTAPIADRSQGYYRTSGFNTVTSWCSGAAQSFSGYGGQPFEDAYAYALSTGGYACLFTAD